MFANSEDRMMSNHRALLALGLVLLSGVCVLGQTRPAHQPPRPGVWQGGKFIGFVPAHERQQRPNSAASSRRHQEPDSAADGAASVSVMHLDDDDLDLGSVDVAPAIHLDESIEPDSLAFEPEIASRSTAIWGRSEYLLWWTQGMDVTPLATTSPAGTAQSQAGVLGATTTTTLFGGGEVNGEVRSGGRYTTGLWFDDWQCHGVQLTYLGLLDETESFNGLDASTSILARPFRNTQSGEDARLIAYPGVVAGNLAIAVTTEFQTLEALYRFGGMCTPCARIDYVFGYRFAELQDRLLISESTQSLSGATAGTTIDLFDQFDSRNRFHGAEFGMIVQWQCRPCWSWEAEAKISLGGLESRGVLAGQETRTTTTSQTFPNGLLVQGTNAGTFWEENFETITEFGITLKREFTCGMTATFGYSFIYWTDVMRAADQIDRSINTTQIPPGTLSGESRPSFPFGKADFWAQGLRFGVEYQF